MIKKWLNIITVSWLVIALVFCHPVFAEHTHPQLPVAAVETSHADNTLLDVFLNHLMANKGHKKPHHKKVLAKIRFVSVRIANIDILLPQTSAFTFGDQITKVCFSWFKFWERKSFLPPHHNFLFRLSPF